MLLGLINKGTSHVKWRRQLSYNRRFQCELRHESNLSVILQLNHVLQQYYQERSSSLIAP